MILSNKYDHPSELALPTPWEAPSITTVTSKDDDGKFYHDYQIKVDAYYYVRGLDYPDREINSR